MGRLGSGAGWLIVVLIVAIWFLSGIYTVAPSEVALVKRFGKFTQAEGPGFHYRLPWPIESVVVVDSQSVRTEEIGFQSKAGVPSTQFPTKEEEALTLTGDFNIISVETVVQYDVTNSEIFAFQVEDYRRVIREAAQAVIREKVATRGVDEALTDKREEIASEIQRELQGLLNNYGTGMRIINVRLQEVTPPTQEVAAAFDDVNSAVQDKERLIFEAQGYSNEQLPRADGQAQQILNVAEGYKQSRILRSEGDVARFLSILDRYRLGKTVTEARLYIETMEEILPNLNKIILSKESGGVLNLLDLERLLGSSTGGEK
ncbi:MAG: HflK protein [Candidatus Fraserbacteria bacterium RBG_16_55_9]|uniref:Protein HflK n=1 Tax=Fraserbacteria sp. (strain RBG_16_55_9) TaxID=1817864 RepID=A0A1F5V0G0_FRAXR|nr:MAG: HflK protein [Candidatus Fraserbacteria bacterium RBG_16_55_9]